MNLNQCRLCCKTDNVAVGVFDVAENDLCDKIRLCFGVQIKPDDPITKQICRCCYYFTNSAYEHRIISQQNDTKLKREYEEIASKNLVHISITQNDFLNNLKLTNNKEDARSYNTPVLHPSVKSIKRKYPNINIPKYCYTLDLDPYVDVLNPKKKKQINTDTSWSISNNDSASSLVLKMVKTDMKDEINSDTEGNKKITRRRLSSTSSDCSGASSFKLTRSSSRALGSLNTSDKKIITSDNDSEYKSDSKPFTCSSCKRSFTRERYLKKHRCKPEKKTRKYIRKNVEGPKASQLSNSKLNNLKSPKNKSETFKSPNVVPPTKKQQLTEANTDLKTLLDINDSVPKSLSKNDFKEEESQEIPEKKEPLEDNNTNTINKENLNKPVETPTNTKDSDKSDPSANVSDLLVEGEKVNAFLCLTCNKVFDTADSLKYHKRYTHKLSLRCDKCTKKFSVVEKLMKHKEIHENFKRKREASAKAKALLLAQTDETSKESKDTEESNDSTIVSSNEDFTSSEEVPKVTEVPEITGVPEITQVPKCILATPKKGRNIETALQETLKRKETIHETDEIIVLSPATLKRAANLPQLSVTLEPLEYTQNKIISPQPTRGRMVAKKRTDGALFVPNSSENTNISSGSDSSLSSTDDDDDCKITEVFTNNQIFTNNQFFTNNQIFTNNEVTKQQASPVPEAEKQLIETAPEPQSIPKEDHSVKDNPVRKDDVQNNTASSDEVYIIDSDSDSETRKNATQSKKPNTQLTVQLDKVKNLETFGDESTENSKSPIIISSDFEEKQKSLPTTSNTKITNELNYINYLYNRCSYDEKSVMNGSQYWTLQQIKKLVKHSIIPIEINHKLDQNVSIKYATTKKKPKQTIPVTPWNYHKAIDLNVGVNNKTAKQKQTTQQTNKQDISKTPKASIKVPIPSAVKPQIVNGPAINQFTTKYVPNTETPTIEQNQILQGPVQQIQQIQSNIVQVQQNQTQIAQSVPNKNVASNQPRSLLKNALTTGTQPILYTYVPTTTMQTKFVTIPTTTESKQSLDQPFLINMANMNHNPTIVFQQIDQPNFINIAQPAFFTTSDNGTSSIYLKQPNLVQETESILSDIPPAEGNQDKVIDVTGNDEPRPMIRIKSLSELTAKPTDNSKEENTSYLNVFANYVNTRNPL